MVFIMANAIDLHAQTLPFAEAKQMLTDYRWSLRRLEQDGQMYNVPEDMRGLVRVFLTNGMTYSFVPSDNESEAEQHKYSVTKTHMTFYIYDDQMTFAYRIEDFIGYKLYMDIDNNGDIVTFVYDRAAKNVVKSVSQTVTIGSQVWAAKNLDVTSFRNGDPIYESKTPEQWEAYGLKGQPTWCYANYDPANKETYGLLYNFYAVKDTRGLAPEGWHIPTIKEVHKLLDYLGGPEVARDKMRTTENWRFKNNGNNSSGFNGIPSGSMTTDSRVYYFQMNCEIWTSSQDTYDDKLRPLFMSLDSAKSNMSPTYVGMFEAGHSVRLIKD